MNNVQHELATNHQRAHSMPTGSLYNRNQLHQPKEGGFPIVNSTKRRHPVSLTDALFFGMTQAHIPIYQQNQSSLCQVELRCKVDRGFFLCDQHWTCYRRNYFQLTTAFTTHCNENQVFYIQNTRNTAGDSTTSAGDESANSLVPIEAFYIQLSATTSESNQRVELIQLTAKRDKGPQQKPSMLPIQPGDGLLLQYPHDNSQRTVTYERLQFKSATANNGKKRATQQYFYLTAQLIAQDANHCQYVVASSQSSPLVVRGRSPGHYADTDQRLQQHHASPLTRPVAKTKRKRNTSRAQNGNNKGDQHESLQIAPTKDINAPIPPSPSSLSPVPMSIVPIVDSSTANSTTTGATTPMPNSSSAPTLVQQRKTAVSHGPQQYHSTSSISSSSISPSSSPPQQTSQAMPAKDTHASVSSSSILTLQGHSSSGIITPTIPSDTTSSSMMYMNNPSHAFNPHGRSFSANDSVWRLQQYSPPHHHHHHHQQQHHQHQQHQQVHDTWSGMHMMAPTWMERQRTDSVATFGSYVSPEESVISSRSSYARNDFPSPPSTTSHHLDSQSMPPPPPSLSTMSLSQHNNDNKSTTITESQLNKATDDPSATTYLLYPNTPWDARQHHGQLADYSQDEDK